MAPKAKTPAPIDRPLSRAYLREFGGLSTAYPPGLSDPTSLRKMENVLVNRDGSASIRPGLRYLGRDAAGRTIDVPVIGTHEAFYLNDGTKAYLFAVAEDSGFVGFRVARANVDATDIDDAFTILDLKAAGFELSYPDSGDIAGWFSRWPCRPKTGGHELPEDILPVTYVKYVQIDNKILALNNGGHPMILFNVSEKKRVKRLSEINRPKFTVDPLAAPADAPIVKWPDLWEREAPTNPIEEISEANRGNNGLLFKDGVRTPIWYNFAYFYVFTNEIGETEPSPITQVEARRPWGAWSAYPSWVFPFGADPGHPELGYGDPFNEGDTSDPAWAADQFLISPPTAAYIEAIMNGATGYDVYMLTWSSQDSVPVEGRQIGHKDLLDEHGEPLNYDQVWVRHNFVTGEFNETRQLPNVSNVSNTTKPPAAANGLVAADRLVLVDDPTRPAVITWTGNNQGDYLNFAAAKGGGYKTLTSGNMQIPATVKLWQNPQSVDTLTILNEGTDGYSTGYYMAPATVTSQSDNTFVMGFEETTATPGTTSPYGCEVFNNALYHPLDDQLMKSTASNYNINHKSQTDQIENIWRRLIHKDHIVSCQHEGRLYYIVHNPDGEPLEDRCFGNEIWVFDATSDSGTWSRLLIQAHALRRIEVLGKLYVSVVRPDGIYFLDEEATLDDVAADVPLYGATIAGRPIPWYLETNTQGANRAHDAWAHLRQLETAWGNLQGSVQYGIRSWDLQGKAVLKKKVLHVDPPAEDGFLLPWDRADKLQIGKDVQEWFFFAGSVPDEEATDGRHRLSAGQINAVQYRYAPVSVNVGYEHGQIETFDYARAAAAYPGSGLSAGPTDAGVPTPYTDVRRP